MHIATKGSVLSCAPMTADCVSGITECDLCPRSDVLKSLIQLTPTQMRKAKLLRTPVATAAPTEPEAWQSRGTLVISPEVQARSFVIERHREELVAQFGGTKVLKALEQLVTKCKWHDGLCVANAIRRIAARKKRSRYSYHSLKIALMLVRSDHIACRTRVLMRRDTAPQAMPDTKIQGAIC